MGEALGTPDVDVNVTGQSVTASVGTVTVTAATFQPQSSARNDDNSRRPVYAIAEAGSGRSPTATGMKSRHRPSLRTVDRQGNGHVAGRKPFTAAVGTATVVGKATATLTGQEIASAAGSVAVTAIQKVNVPVTGQEITALVSGVSVTAGGSVSVSLTGQQLTASVGDVTVAAVAGTVGVWNGTSWVQRPAKVWTGSAWVQKPVKALERHVMGGVNRTAAVVSLREWSVKTLALSDEQRLRPSGSAGHGRPCSGMRTSYPALTERVDSSRRASSVAERSLTAAADLRHSRILLGEHGYALVGKVCGDGYHIRDLYRTRRERDTASDMLKSPPHQPGAQMWR